MRRLEVEIHPKLAGLAGQRLCAVLHPVGMAVFWQCPACPGKQRRQIERFVPDGRAVFRRNLLKARTGQIDIGGQRREIVINMGHLAPPRAALLCCTVAAC